MEHTKEKPDFIGWYREQREHKIIGLMSGTSLDGVDAVLVTIHNDEKGVVTKVTLEHQVSIPFNPEMKACMDALCTPGKSDINDLTYAHFGIAHWYAIAVDALIAEVGIDRLEIDAVSMHGQTVWHAPLPKDFPGPFGPIPVTGTLQIGNSQVVASLVGLPVLSDFRAADMAEGGEGAPLAPYIDFLLFGKREEGRAVQNIGGIGNVTVLPLHGSPSDIFAFDTGPGNMIIDAVVSLGTQGKKSFDEGGAIAERGTASQKIVQSLMADPYFSRKPPKSTGREVYGRAFVQEFLKMTEAEGLSFEDTVATATDFTAASIARSYHDFILPVTPLHTAIISGGGARNKTLLAMIAKRMPKGVVVDVSDSFGIPDQAREAMAFAVLGHESLMGRPGNIIAVTGARRPVVLGVITMQHI
ncbi:MAG TPA: anhydro-N-acetylmuramic acid kinase [Sphaerochaeta sp.]|nr:anhydro-N-acetylmuramic acid kinase [Sphaerochaeta sp.]